MKESGKVLLRHGLGGVFAVMAVILALTALPVQAQTDPLFQDLLAARELGESPDGGAAAPVADSPAPQATGQKQDFEHPGPRPTEETHTAAQAHVKALLTDKSGKMADRTGTNPTNLRTTFIMYNEYRHLASNDYFDIFNVRALIPFAHRKANVRITLPFVWTNSTTPQAMVEHGNPLYREPHSGLGDADIRFNWIAWASKKHAFVPFLGITFDSATNEALGRGKNYVQPGLLYAFFLPKNFIFGPAYQHNTSFSGSSNREDINEGYLDLYMVKVSKLHLQWIIIDPQIIIDYEHDNRVTGKLEIEMGAIFIKVKNAAGSFYFRPGVGFGPTRYVKEGPFSFFVPYGSKPYTWNAQMGIKLIW